MGWIEAREHAKTAKVKIGHPGTRDNYPKVFLVTHQYGLQTDTLNPA